jgi:NAD(P)-dependent dehydrogenase (short-subunit alcohol dehydrogenase family)
MSAVIIFGATGGIGSELSRRLRERGENLMLTGRNQDRLDSLRSELGASVCPVEATSTEEVNTCVTQAVEQFGSLSGVVNCVGSVLLKPAHITTDTEWSHTIATNLTSAFIIVRAAVKAMQQSGGSIVLISSAAARTGLANHEAIASAKAGIIGLTRSAAASYAARQIRVNCVAPGLVKTPLTAKITASEKSLATSTAMHALQRVGEPADVASAIAWLLDPGQSWITGQVIGVDGGLGTVRTRGG